MISSLYVSCVRGLTASIINITSKRGALGWIMIALALFVSACQNPKSAIVDEWVIDEAVFYQSLAQPKVDPPAGVIAQELSAPIVTDWRFQFNADRTIRMSLNGELRAGRYTITKVISSTLYIKVETRPIYERALDDELNLPSREGLPCHLASARSGPPPHLS